MKGFERFSSSFVGFEYFKVVHVLVVVSELLLCGEECEFEFIIFACVLCKDGEIGLKFA